MMTYTKECFGELLGQLAAELKLRGYKKRGALFYKPLEGNLACIEIQKSRKSSAEEVLFTVNLGIVNSKIHSFTSSTPMVAEIEKSHWRMRLGALTDSPRDIWWEIKPGADMGVLNNELWALISVRALPTLDRYCKNDELAALWLTGRSPGLTEFERLINLSILLQNMGRTEELDRTLDALLAATANSPSESVARSHVRKLRGVS